jgi:MinD superfamily P-loop ATPase
MWVGVLSGKGGTGKTSVAAMLARAWDGAQYVDCDVEAPNGYHFLKPDIFGRKDVLCSVPAVDLNRCNLCGLCGESCEFNAIACLQDRILFFPEICHHCGACVLVCPQKALYEVDRSIGVIEWNQDKTFIQGKLTIGEPVGVPIVRALKNITDGDRPAVFDCPPGAACTVVQALDRVDLALLVTEPTPFGLHDMRIAANLLRKLQIPCMVVINKSTEYSRLTRRFCADEDLAVAIEIPFDLEIARQYSKGELPWEYGIELKCKVEAFFS